MKKIMTVLITIATFALIAPLAHAATDQGQSSEYKYGSKYTQISASNTEMTESGKANHIAYHYGKKYIGIAPKNAEQSQEKVSYRYGVKYKKVA